MAICIVKDIEQFSTSTSNIVDQYGVDPKKIVNIIKTRGLRYFAEKYRGAFMYGMDAIKANEIYTPNKNKKYDIKFDGYEDMDDTASTKLFSKGKQGFGSSDFSEFMKFVEITPLEKFINLGLFSRSKSSESIEDDVYDSRGANLYVKVHRVFGKIALTAHDSTTAELEYSIMKISDIEQVFSATNSTPGADKNPIFTEIFKKLTVDMTSMAASIKKASKIEVAIPNPADGQFKLLDTAIEGGGDPKLFSTLLGTNGKDKLINYLKDKLPAYDESLDDQKMNRIIAAVNATDSNYVSLRIAIKTESSNDQKYSGLMGYHNLFGFYNFIDKISGYNASIAQSRKASQINPSSKEVDSGEISYFESSKNYYTNPGDTPDDFIVNEQDLVSIVNNLVKSGDIDRSKDLIMVLNYKYKADRSVKRYSLNTISGKGAAANKKLAVTLKVQIERIGAISVVTGQKPSVLKIKIPAASINESFYKEFAKILKNSVRNSF